MTVTVELMARALEEVGTPFVVGHPGGETVEFMAAAEARGIRFILMKQETAGAILASTWGEITGRPGLCVSTRGPGAANMINGVAHAYLDRCPLLVFTDQYPPAVYDSGLRQRLDQQALYRPITRWNGTLRAKTAPQQIRRALRVAMGRPPGPVQFDIPANETMAEIDEEAARGSLLPVAAASQAPEPVLDEALAMLIKARRPIVLAGLGVCWDQAHGALQQFVEALGAPLLTTPKSKGLLAENHILSGGCIIGGLIERKLVEQADLIITVGLDAVELQPKPWPYRTPVLSLATHPTEDALVPAALEAVGDLGPMLSDLAGRIGGEGSWGEEAAREFRKDVRAALDRPTAGLSPQAVVNCARDVLPADTVATCDAGASRLLVVQLWQTLEPRGFLTSNGLATMGFAIPGALAARLAHPKRPIIAFTGDGGFMMALAELRTAARENLPVTVLVFDDQEIALIRIKQEIKGLEPLGVDLGKVEWEALAKGFGADCWVVESEQALGDALQAAATSERLSLVVARIDGGAYVDQFNALREL